MKESNQQRLAENESTNVTQLSKWWRNVKNTEVNIPPAHPKQTFASIYKPASDYLANLSLMTLSKPIAVILGLAVIAGSFTIFLKSVGLDADPTSVASFSNLSDLTGFLTISLSAFGGIVGAAAGGIAYVAPAIPATIGTVLRDGGFGVLRTGAQIVRHARDSRPTTA